MKSLYKTLIFLAAIFGLATLGAAHGTDHKEPFDESHAAGSDHKEKKKAGPNGGRVVQKTNPNFEFFVAADGIAKITFLDENGTPVPAAKQTATLVGGERANPIILAFLNEGDILVSNKALPTDKVIPVVLQILETPGSSLIREKFNLNMSTCSGCKLGEYACICGH